MGADKGGVKGGGFFQLFDWNRKSRKKLFSVSPEGTKQVKRSEENLPAAHLRLIDEDEVVGVSSGKGSSDYSCASSVTDEEGIASRAPGVVARLMGLDSMPTSGAPEPYTTPLFETRSLRDSRNYKRSPEFYMNDQFKHRICKDEGHSRKPMDLWSQKMPSSPVERFRTEILPPRSARTLSMAHHKLLSPIKNPGFISPKNAAHIMEAAAKILDPGFPASTGGRASSFASSSIPLRNRDYRECQVPSQSSSSLLEPARAPVYSADLRSLRGQPLSRRSPEFDGSNTTSGKGKGKSISLAIQAKVNVQRREGLSNSNRNISDQRDHDACRLNQTFKSQPSTQKNKPQEKPVTANASGVLRQNNQKQNCQSTSKQMSSNQSSRKVLNGSYTGKSKAFSNISGNSRVGYRKEGLQKADHGREGTSSSNKDFPQKKRLIDHSFYYDKSDFSDNILADRHEKLVQPSVVIDQHLRWAKDNKRDAMDVISFTFTSPLVKPMQASRPSLQVAEKSNRRNIHASLADSDSSASNSKEKKAPSFGLNAMNGDALSLLLEQKLRELTAGVELSDSNFIKSGSSTTSSSVVQESTSTVSVITAIGEGHEELSARTCKDKPGSVIGYGVSSTRGQLFGISHKPQAVEELDYSSRSDARKEPNCQRTSPLSILEASFTNDSCNSSESCSASTNESNVCLSSIQAQNILSMNSTNKYVRSDARKEPNCQRTSPLSILEASFSNDSCNSYESCSASTNESKVCSSSIQAQNILSMNSTNKFLPLHSEMDLLDSASSAISETVDGGNTSETRPGSLKAYSLDLEYVKQVLQNTGIMSKGIGSCYVTSGSEPLDSHLFDKLESKRRWNASEGEDRESRLRRKMTFDCVNECLDMRCSRYFRAGCRAWTRGVAIVGKELAEEICQEISGWKSMGDWMVDELVDKDMSNHLGRWVDFESEAFETGVDIEHDIMSSLVDEILADFLI